MSTALIQFTDTEIDLLRRTIAPGTNKDQLALFVQVCSQLGLNPFARQIYAVVRKEAMTIQTSIDGYRLLAQRSGEYAGQEGPFWYDAEAREWTDVWIKNEPPAAAKVGVMRKGFAKPIYAVARFDSYAARYNGNLTNLWAKMPELMIAKVAEALALRRAFPAELSGIYTSEEMQQADIPLPTVVVSNDCIVDAPTPPQDEQQSIQSDQSMQLATFDQIRAIANLYKRLNKQEQPVGEISFVEARKLINQLNEECKARPKAS